MSLVASSHGSMEPGCIRAVFPGAGLIQTSSFNVARSNEITRYVKAAKLAQPRKMCSYNTSYDTCQLNINCDDFSEFQVNIGQLTGVTRSVIHHRIVYDRIIEILAD